MQKAIEYIKLVLTGLYPEQEIKSFTLLIIGKLTGFSRTEIILNKNTLFSVEQHQLVESFIQKLKDFVPIQYILGETEFYGLPFSVNEHVLIPRPETEELVDWIINENSVDAGLSLLDIGTGSGCIAISLKKHFQKSTVEAFDISEKALETAAANAKLNGVDVNFRKLDILNAPVVEKKWDVIVSNPPYVLEREKSEMQPNVLEHEPHLALFVPDNDPLLFYRKIADFAGDHLNTGGKLYFEINRAFGTETVEMLEKAGFRNVEVRKDISGNDRMIRACLAANVLTIATDL